MSNDLTTLFGDVNLTYGPFQDYPLYRNGPDALLGFLRGTQSTPIVGTNVFQFALEKRTEAQVQDFIQAMRVSLSNRRRQARASGIAPAKFTMQTVSVIVDEASGTALVALGRRQKDKKAKHTTSLEVLTLLADKELSHSAAWQALVVDLETQARVSIPADDWNKTALAVIMVKQGNAVYRGYDKETNAHLIGQF